VHSNVAFDLTGDDSTVRARPRLMGRAWLVGLLATCAAVALLSAGCSKPDTTNATAPTVGTGGGPSTVVPVDEGTPKTGGTLMFGIDAEPDGLDPTSNELPYDGHLLVSPMLETLTVFDDTGAPKPFLAQSIEPKNLATLWTITLKPNIKFHDGSPLNAEALRANLEAARKGIGGIGLKAIESVTVTGDLTVDVQMNQPWAAFPGLMASQFGYQLAPATLGTPGIATHPVGTGPYVFQSWERGSQLTVKKNPNYWQAGKPYLDGITFRFIPDAASRANALTTGDLDAIVTEQPGDIAQYRAKPDFKTIIEHSGDAEYIFMNQAAAPFDNADARRAVILATDNAALVSTIGGGILQPIDQPFPPGSPYHQDDPHYPHYDLDAAKKAAADYQAEAGKPITFTLTVWSGTTNLQIAQILQEQWQKAGINVDIKSKDQSDAIKDALLGAAQAGMVAGFSFPDPDFNFYLWHSSFTAPVGQLSVNFPHLKNQQLDDTLQVGKVNLVPSLRQDAYKKAVTLLNDGSTYVWLYRIAPALIANNTVRGLRGAETDGFAATTSKSWYADLWLDR
jgi:peptide/nickel transport system substrate-binding protein